MTSSPQPTRILRAQPDFVWPGGKKICIVFNIAFEGWSEGEAPGIGPMGNVLKPGYFDANADSWAKYGPTRGVQRLDRIAQANGVKTSIMVNGVLCERAPDAVRALHHAGHDVYAHSWGMDVIPVYLDDLAARENIRRNTQLLRSTTGETPVGWISPRGTGAPGHPKMLAEEGYLWHGDCNDDDLPAVWEFDNGKRIVAIPLTMDVNDLPHSIRYGNGPGALIDQFEDILENAIEADGAPFMLDVTAHAHVYGRPANAWAYDAMMKIALERPDVWIATRREIAQYSLQQVEAGTIA